MLSRFGAQPLLFGTGLLLAALSLANVSILGIAAIPLLLLVTVAFLRAPEATTATLDVDRKRLYVGQEVRVRVHVELRPGRGPIDVAVPLPDSFFLTEGSNLHHRWCDLGTRTIDFEFTARCDQRGIQEIRGVNVESTHPTLLGATQARNPGPTVAIRVQPRWARLRRMRARRLRSKSPIPELDLSATGVQTTEFEDIRAYQWGDSPRSVNWKASARRLALGETQLLVNKYEKEGKRMAWIFLDAGGKGLIGTSLDNAFERRLEAAYSLASHFLNRGYLTGFSLFNAAQSTDLYPDLSSKQKAKILELVHKLGPTESKTTLEEAVTHAKPHLAPKRTVAFVITSVGTSATGLAPGLRMLRGRLGHVRGRVPAVLIHVNPFGLVPEAQKYGLARVTSLLARPSLDEVSGLGIFTLDWDPPRKSLASLLRRVAP